MEIYIIVQMTPIFNIKKAFTDIDLANLTLEELKSTESNSVFTIVPIDLNQGEPWIESIEGEGVLVTDGNEEEIAFFFVRTKLVTDTDGSWDYSKEGPREIQKYELQSVKAFGKDLSEFQLTDYVKNNIQNNAEYLVELKNEK